MAIEGEELAPEPEKAPRAKTAPPIDQRLRPTLSHDGDTLRPATDLDSAAPCRIFIEKDYFIPVDERGYCVGRYWEGALGCVVRLVSIDERDYRVIKIPRLRADTLPENAYIDELNEQEVAFAQEFGGKSNLLGWWTVHPLRQDRIWKHGTAEQKQQRDQIVLVRFEKGKAPRFVSVGLDRRSVPADLHDLPDQDTIGKLMRMLENGTPGTHVVACGDNGGGLSPMRLREALLPKNEPEPWFCFVPSIIYHWASTNLQEAICEGLRGCWQLKDHLELVHRVAEAIAYLHAHGCLHADLRPANIMVTGVQGAEMAKSYDLGDFGSLSRRQPGEDQRRGDTLVGPRVGSERTSPFYAPERRMAIERESADTAIVLGRPAEGGEEACVLVLLGWQKALVTNNRPNPDLVSALESAVVSKIEPVRIRPKASETPDRESLQQGDRVRLRDYVFTVRSEGRLQGCRVLVCNEVVSRTSHGSLVITYGCDDQPLEMDEVRRDGAGAAAQDDADEPPFLTPEVLRLPSVVELQKWGAAVDLYGLGALALYSVYCEAFRTAEERRDALGEYGFGEMILQLESRAFFHATWQELDNVCRQLDRLAEQCADGSSVQLSADALETVKSVTNNLTRSVPNLWWIWRAVRNQADAAGNQPDNGSWPHFLLFVHFVMGCLHRRSHIKAHDDKTAGEVPAAAEWPLGPFSADRLEPPQLKGPPNKAPAQAALDRLGRLLLQVTRGVFGIVRIEGKPDEYRPLHDDMHKLRIDNSAMRSTIEKARGRQKQIVDVLEPLTKLSPRELQRRIGGALAELGPLLNSMKSENSAPGAPPSV